MILKKIKIKRFFGRKLCNVGVWPNGDPKF